MHGSERSHSVQVTVLIDYSRPLMFCPLEVIGSIIDCIILPFAGVSLISCVFYAVCQESVVRCTTRTFNLRDDICLCTCNVYCSFFPEWTTDKYQLPIQISQSAPQLFLYDPFDIILPSTCRSPKCSLSFRFF